MNQLFGRLLTCIIIFSLTVYPKALVSAKLIQKYALSKIFMLYFCKRMVTCDFNILTASSLLVYR